MTKTKEYLFKNIPVYEAWIVIISLLINFPLLGANVIDWQAEGLNWRLIPIGVSTIATMMWLISAFFKRDKLRHVFFLINLTFLIIMFVVWLFLQCTEAEFKR